MNSNKLSQIELFAFDTTPSFADRPVRAGSLYLLLRLTWGEQIHYGACEIEITRSGQSFDLTRWGAPLRCIHHSTVEEILVTLRRKEQEWATGQLGLLQSALSGILQVRVPVTAGHGEHAHQGNSHAVFTPYPVNSRFRELTLSRLIDESVAYYSILR
ncbi:hypothetical protein MKZ24_30160 [Paenibacillus sp. FSL R7-0297]|uniref:hypothetical protein n=1 Tax=unclassified Paenibacillus TaxID=185978 RepID=UPI0004F60F61|nr:hypothetical protein [Paenibacillus sp. FSL R5-0912]AIQ39952.1 hypothetical protein R50912_07870 [Paenibacillus sp. FSL R5-0912]